MVNEIPLLQSISRVRFASDFSEIQINEVIYTQ